MDTIAKALLGIDPKKRAPAVEQILSSMSRRCTHDKIPLEKTSTIVGLSMGLYKAWAAIHPDATDEECAAELLKIMGAVAIDDARGGSYYETGVLILLILLCIAAILIGVNILYKYYLYWNYAHRGHIGTASNTG